MIGIDVSKDKLDVHILKNNKHLVVANSINGIKKLVKMLQKNKSLSMFVFEPTGCYSKELEVYCLNENLPYHKVHLNKVNYFAKSKVGHVKTDKIDAKILAQYAEQNNIEPENDNSTTQIERQELCSYMNEIKDRLAGLNAKAKCIYINGLVKKSIKKRINQLKKEVELIKQELDKMIKEDDDLASKHKILESISGVGKETARLLVTGLPELGKVSREAISSLVGLAPYNRDSGKKSGYRRIIGGRFHIRKGLYMSALVASRHNPRMKKIYQDLLGRGKKPKVALVAVMRKMLIMMNTMVKNNTPWVNEI